MGEGGVGEVSTSNEIVLVKGCQAGTRDDG